MLAIFLKNSKIQLLPLPIHRPLQNTAPPLTRRQHLASSSDQMNRRLAREANVNITISSTSKDRIREARYDYETVKKFLGQLQTYHSNMLFNDNVDFDNVCSTIAAETPRLLELGFDHQKILVLTGANKDLTQVTELAPYTSGPGVAWRGQSSRI